MAATWRVTDQTEAQVLTPRGTFEHVMEVRYETMPEGISGMVQVPWRLYTEDYVRTVIEERVQAIKAVSGL